MGRKKHKISEREIAGYVISTKETAELFIKRWMDVHGGTRRKALARLRELGIKYAQLRDKQ